MAANRARTATLAANILKEEEEREGENEMVQNEAWMKVYLLSVLVWNCSAKELDSIDPRTRYCNMYKR